MTRHYMLELQARYWPGPMSIVFYGTTDEAEALRRAVLSSPILSTRTNIAYHLVLRRTAPSLHPGNILRNIALKQVHTPYAISIDIDFLARPGMCQRLQKFLRGKTRGGGGTAAHHALDKVAYIIPSFAEYFTNRSEFLSQFPQNKTALIKLWKNSFQQNNLFGTFADQSPTNFSRWNNEDDEPYEIHYREQFEPIYLYRLQTVEDAAKFIKKELPEQFHVETRYFGWFPGYRDFRHFGAMTLALLGFRMFVLPNEYMIHVMHDFSEARENRSSFEVCRDESWTKFNRHRKVLCDVQKKIDVDFYKLNSVCEKI